MLIAGFNKTNNINIEEVIITKIHVFNSPPELIYNLNKEKVSA